MAKTKKTQPRIAFTGQKGGPGKSSIAMNIIAGLSVLGYKVLVIDTDEHQATIRDACARRDDANISTVCIRTENLLKELAKPQLTEGYDIVIIDGEGHMHEASRAAIEVSTYFVIPMQPSQYDMDSYAKYVASVIKPVAMYRELSGGVVLNRTKKGASSRDTRDALEEHLLPLFDAEIPDSESFKDAAGLGLCVTEFRPRIKASRMFFDFLVELCDAADVSTKKVGYAEFSRRANLKRKAIKERSDAEAKKGQHTRSNSLRVQQEGVTH